MKKKTATNKTTTSRPTIKSSGVSKKAKIPAAMPIRKSRLRSDAEDDARTTTFRSQPDGGQIQGADTPRRICTTKGTVELIKNQGADTPRSPETAVKSRLPVAVLETLERACRSGKWIFAVWRYEDGNVLLDRTAMDFPDTGSAIEVSMRLIVENLQELKKK